MKYTGLVGNGGQADEVESYLNNPTTFRAVDSEYVTDGLIDINNPTDDQKNTPIIVAVGAPLLRRDFVKKWQGDKFDIHVSENASVHQSLEIGEGSVVAPGAIITTNVSIGTHVIVNIGATVSHNTSIGDYVTISPGVSIAGNVTIGSGVFIGIGATISNNISIAEGVVIGAGAVVVSSIAEENSVYAGVPAKKIGQNEGWLHEL